MREKDVIEAMRKIVEMMAKGQDVSDLFPSVVKNVVSKSTEVRNVKLYSYRSISFSQSIRNLRLTVSHCNHRLKSWSTCT